MSLAVVQTRACIGLEAPVVLVEAHISNGLPQLTMVGLPDTEVKESRDRVRSALLNAHFEFPTRRITVNLAPADLPKQGSRFDLAIALGILAASTQLPTESLRSCECVGELALSGALRPIPGVLPFAIAAKKANHSIIVPRENADEASLAGKDLTVFAAESLLEVCAHLSGRQRLTPYLGAAALPSADPGTLLDLSEVRGQFHAKRALEIAAAGGHNLLFIGPPGTGKTMLASRLPSILPSMTEEEALTVATIASMSSKGFQLAQWRQRPFRAPHHTASSPALVGGGNPPRAGEISLAHGGVLFLDEFPEFKRSVLESLREPLESRAITISRAAYQAQFPAHFQLIAAMNPCPCGHAGSVQKACVCTEDQIKRYQKRLSAPLLDRIDMHVEVPMLPKGSFSQAAEEESSALIKQRVAKARDRQYTRQSALNSTISNPILRKHAHLASDEQTLLDTAMETFGLSGRAYYRILRVARTIADLASSPSILASHLTEALNYRCLERRLLTS